MTAEKRRELRRLEGRTVHVSLAGGSRLDDVDLVSARGLTLWVFDHGEDVFVRAADVIDFWPSETARSAA